MKKSIVDILHNGKIIYKDVELYTDTYSVGTDLKQCDAIFELINGVRLPMRDIQIKFKYGQLATATIETQNSEQAEMTLFDFKD